MASDDLERQWAPEWASMTASMAQWRAAHPRATLMEIEAALDERMAPLRAQMLADTALVSRSAKIGGVPRAERPTCSACGRPLVSRGGEERTLQTNGGQDIRLRRDYGECPACGVSLFPPG